MGKLHAQALQQTPGVHLHPNRHHQGSPASYLLLLLFQLFIYLRAIFRYQTPVTDPFTLYYHIFKVGMLAFISGMIRLNV